MQVLMDAHMIGQGETGNETYVLNLLRQHRFFYESGVVITALVRPGAPIEAEWAKSALLLTHTGDLARLCNQIPTALAKTRADLLHVTYHAPFWLRAPYVVTIHDASYRIHPRYHRLRNVLLQNLLGALTAWRARAAITVSDFCYREILRMYPFLEKRLFVTPEAADDRWFPRRWEAVTSARQARHIGERYLLWVGRLQPRKNLLRLIQAFLRATQDMAEVQLVLAGNYDTPLGATVRREFKDALDQHRLTMTGYVDDETLACLYSGCEAFVFPSLYEGFGLPVLEAMQCAAPVITSNVTALPEVAGDAALLVNPNDTEAIVHAIRQVLTQPAMRQTLRERGLRRAAQFSWMRTAALTVEAYRFALGREISR